MLIETKTSFLSCQTLPFEMTACVEEITGKLLEKPPIVIFGKTVHQRRNIGFFSNTSKGYRYSNQIALSQSLTPALTLLLDTVNEMYKAEFNGILVNHYVDGNDYISAHSDDETMLDPVGVVAVSYGAVRKFRIREKASGTIVKDIPMVSGQILHMGGSFQKEFTHEIPVEKKIKEARFSFTFRRHKE